MYWNYLYYFYMHITRIKNTINTKLIYYNYYIFLNCDVFLWWQSWIFSIITPVFSDPSEIILIFWFELQKHYYSRVLLLVLVSIIIINVENSCGAYTYIHTYIYIYIYIYIIYLFILKRGKHFWKHFPVFFNRNIKSLIHLLHLINTSFLWHLMQFNAE